MAGMTPPFRQLIKEAGSGRSTPTVNGSGGAKIDSIFSSCIASSFNDDVITVSRFRLLKSSSESVSCLQ